MTKPSDPGWYLCDCGGKPGYIQGDLAMYFDGKNVLTSPMGPRCLLPMTNFRRLVLAEESAADLEALRAIGGNPWEGHHPCTNCRMPAKDGQEFCDEDCERELASDRGTGQAG